MSDIVSNEQVTNIEEPLTKPKKPKTAKQLEAFEKVKEKRKQNIESKKQQKLIESAKLLIEQSQKQPQPAPKKEPKYEQIKQEDSDSEEEIIVVKKSKPKKKVRKVIIESESESESDEEEVIQAIEKSHVRIMRPEINYDDLFC